ncbi:hypothetical protein Tco_0065971, partial [Tanacetum coccineum]
FAEAMPVHYVDGVPSIHVDPAHFAGLIVSCKCNLVVLQERWQLSLMTSNNVTFIASFIPLIMEYLVKIRKICHICACTSQKTTKEQRPICRIQKKPIRCIQDKKQNILEDIERGPYSKKPPIRLTMTMLIKGEFKKLESLKISDVSLTCNTSLEIFNKEFNRMSRMDDDLFTYEVEIAKVTSIPCYLKKEDDSEQQMSHKFDDDMEYDPSDARGYDEVELADEESSDSKDENEVSKFFRIKTNVFDFETPLCRAFKNFNYLLQIDPDVLTNDIERFKTYKDYKDDWIYEWNKDNGQPVARGTMDIVMEETYHIVGNALPYQDFEWYESLKDGKLKKEALKNKAIMKGIIVKIMSQLIQDEEYVAVKENEYDDSKSTSEDACRTYQEIFHMMDEGWMVTRAE